RTEEALRTKWGRELRPKHLDGDVPVVLDVAREVHGGHATHTEFPLDVIAAAENGCEMLDGIQLSEGRCRTEDGGHPRILNEGAKGSQSSPVPELVSQMSAEVATFGPTSSSESCVAHSSDESLRLYCWPWRAAWPVMPHRRPWPTTRQLASATRIARRNFSRRCRRSTRCSRCSRAHTRCRAVRT